LTNLSNSREISTTTDSGKETDRKVLGSLLITTGSLPPSHIWLISPWLTDFDFVNDASLPFRSLGWDTPIIRFSDVLIELANSGWVINLVLRSAPENEPILTTIKNAINSRESVQILRREPVHKKGLLLPGVLIKGSMNFTYSGFEKSDEEFELETDLEKLSSFRLEAIRDYEEFLESI